MKTKRVAQAIMPQIAGPGDKPPALQGTENNSAEYKEMYDAATLLAEDKAGCDVEFAFFAQAEAVLASP